MDEPSIKQEMPAIGSLRHGGHCRISLRIVLSPVPQSMWRPQQFETSRILQEAHGSVPCKSWRSSWLILRTDSTGLPIDL